MGRFRVYDDDDSGFYAADDRRQTQAHTAQWEFVAERGDTGAMVVSRRRPRIDENCEQYDDDELSNYTDNDSPRDEPTGMHFRQQQQRDSPCDDSYNGDTNCDTWASDIHADESIVQRRHSPPKRSMVSMLTLLTILVLFLSWLTKEGPPGPPNTTQNWNEFLWQHSEHFLQSSNALLLQTPFHLIKWWMIHLQYDAGDAYERWTRPGLCKLQLSPDTIVDSSNLLIGQDVAVTTVVDALEAWYHGGGSSNVPSSPLLLYLAGFASSGKATLAKRLHNVLYPINAKCIPPMILQLNGNDFADASLPTQQQLNRRMLQSQGFVLVENVHEMDASLFAWLVNQLAMESFAVHDVDHSLYEDTLNTATRAPIPTPLRQHCSGHIILFTSTIGSTSIAKGLRPSTGAGYLLDLVDEIDVHFGQGVSDHFHAIAPFQPLLKEHMAEILNEQVETYSNSNKDVWNSISLSPRAIDALLAPGQVEYLDWKQQAGANITFSTSGAFFLDLKRPIWNKIRAAVKRCRLDNDPKQHIVMDVREQEAILLQCPSGRMKASCKEICRQPLQS
jgi:hypothetical protein